MPSIRNIYIIFPPPLSANQFMWETISQLKHLTTVTRLSTVQP